MTISRIGTHLITLAAALVLAGCGGSSSNDSVEPADGEIQYAPLAGLVPSPNDLAFQGSTDGTLNTSGESAVDAAVNSIDGFSTNTSATLTATVPLDGSTITPGDTVRVFAVETNGDPNSTTATGPDDAGPKVVTRLTTNGVLEPGTEYKASLSTADRNGRTLAVTPSRPLKSDQTYMVVVTNGVQERGGGAINASQQYRLTKRTSPLVDGSGNSTVDSLTDKEAQNLEPVRQLVAGVDTMADGNLDGDPDVGQIPVIEQNTSLSSEEIVASWTFTTQTIGDSLAAIQDKLDTSQANGSSAVFNSLTPGGPTPNGNATIYAGVLAGNSMTDDADLPYYLEGNSNEPKKVRTGFWERRTDANGGGILTPADNVPAAQENEGDNVIPTLVTVPNESQDDIPAVQGVVIFQHGITSNRTAVLAIADTLAQFGYTTVAIDLPLHGIVFQENEDPCADDPSSQACAIFQLRQEGRERHFGVDLVDNDGDDGPDGLIDPSGEHFFNLASLQTSRDNLRQAVVDLFGLTNAIQAAASNNVDLNGTGNDDFQNNIKFVGHSLGGIVGGVFLANEPAVGDAVLGMSGGGIAKLLDGSPQIGPDIRAGLKARRLTPGTPAYEQFLGAAQLVIDSGDPLNYANLTKAGGTNAAGTTIQNRNVLALEVVGGNSSDPPDQVVPNFVDPSYPGTPSGTVPSPTSGTDPLVFKPGMDLTQVASNKAPGDYVLQFVAGDHGSLLRAPDDEPSKQAVLKEMQSTTGIFIGGSDSPAAPPGSVVIDDTSLVEAPP